MSSTDRSGTIWSGFVAPVCAASLVAAVAVAMTASWALQQLGAGPGVVAPSEVFSWTESLNWRSAPTVWPEGQALASLSPEALPSLVPSSPRVKRSRAVNTRKLAHKSLAQAALPKIALAKNRASESETLDTESDQSRAQWLDLYRSWHSQFRIALESPLESDSAPQVLAQVAPEALTTQAEYSTNTSGPEIVSQVSAKKADIQKRVFLRQKAIERAQAAQKATQSAPAPVVLSSVEKPVSVDSATRAPAALATVSAPSSDQVVLSAASPSISAPRLEGGVKAPLPSKLSIQNSQPSKLSLQVAAATERAGSQVKGVQVKNVIAQSSEPKAVLGLTGAVSSVSTQRTPEMLASFGSKTEDLGDYSVGRQKQSRRAAAVSIRVKAVDAFDETREADVQVRTLTYQGSAQRPEAPWVKVEAQDSWPVVAQAPAGVRASTVPVLSKNSVLLLARGQGLSVMPSSALVYGKVPSGKRVRLSGRSEEALYWSRPDGTRWFMVLNAAPGAAVLQMDSGEAVAVPALEATAVYLDLRDLRTETLAGQVFEGAQAKPTAVAGAWVSLVGQSAKRVQTDSQGRFRLEGVRRVGQYPLHLEVSQGSEFVHRYEVTQNTENLSLFRFSSASIQTWVKQLEGGVSAESGMVLAAFPGWSSTSGKSRFKASLYPVQVGQGLVPETYSLDRLDRLQPGIAMDQQSPRALAVQVPQGLNLLKLVPESGKSPAWTQWVYSSPGVVNVILAQ